MSLRSIFSSMRGILFISLVSFRMLHVTADESSCNTAGEGVPTFVAEVYSDDGTKVEVEVVNLSRTFHELDLATLKRRAINSLGTIKELVEELYETLDDCENELAIFLEKMSAFMNNPELINHKSLGEIIVVLLRNHHPQNFKKELLNSEGQLIPGYDTSAGCLLLAIKGLKMIATSMEKQFGN